MPQGLVVTFEQKIAPLTPIWEHITVMSNGHPIVSNHWQSDRLFNRLSRLIQKINQGCWLCVCVCVCVGGGGWGGDSPVIHIGLADINGRYLSDTE